MIPFCEQHIRNMAAITVGEDIRDEDPRWAAFDKTKEAISAARPRTLAGMVAKAKVAKLVAAGSNGTEDPCNTVAEDWAWDLVNDLVRLADEVENVTGRRLHYVLRDAVAMSSGVSAPGPDADLLALRPEYERLRAEVDAENARASAEGWNDNDGFTGFKEFDYLCGRIARMPRAVTQAGRALKAIAVMHQLTYAGADEGVHPALLLDHVAARGGRRLSAAE